MKGPDVDSISNKRAVSRARQLMPRIWVGCRRTLKVVALVIGITAGSIGAYCGALRLLGNVHTVEEGRFYRSAQLDADGFKRVIKEYEIKSILNLRGKAHGEPWYEQERAVSAALGVKHYDYGIWASSPVSNHQIDQILAIIRSAPKPILVHCNGGADRAGLVSALYLAILDKVSVDQADWQLSLLYGHFPYLISKTGAMDASFWAYVGAGRHMPDR